MFTDIVGYTALMSEDEARTIDLVRANRELHRSLLPEFDGELIDEIGDGTLCWFQSAVDSVRCAIALQRRATRTPDLSLHIGIHLGDVVFSEGKVYGDGVNVASRIESIAEPGCIYVSEQIYFQIKNRSDVRAEYIGQKRFKNVDDPIGVYAIRVEELNPSGANAAEASNQGVSAPATLEAARISPEDEQSIAVLPFDDLSPGRDNEYFSDGLTEEITSDLAQVQRLRVISRTSSMMYKGSDKNVRTIGRELGIRYVLEGSVRKAGNSLRITAQLIDAGRDAHLWSNKYSGTLEDVFDIQETVSRSIVEALRISLSLDEQRAIGRRGVTDLKAHEYLFRARSEIWKGTEASVVQALAYLNEAMQAEKENIEIYSAMVEAYFVLFHLTSGSNEEILGKMEDLSDRILHLDANSSHGHFCQGLVHTKRPWGFRQSAKSFRRAAELSPNDTSVLRMRAMYAASAGKIGVANACLQRLLLLDPVSPVNHIVRLHVQLLSGEVDACAEEVRRVLSNDPSRLMRWSTIQILANARLVDELSAIAEEMRSAPPDVLVRMGLLFDAAFHGRSHEIDQILTPDLKDMARRDDTFSWYMAQCYALLDERDLAVDWLEIAMTHGFINYPWLSQHDRLLDNVRGEARFKQLMSRVAIEWERHEA